MVQFLSINYFSSISSIFVGVFKSSRFFLCHTVEKQKVLHILSVSLVLAIHHAMRMRHIFISVLPRSTVFSHIPHKRHDFLKK